MMVVHTYVLVIESVVNLRKSQRLWCNFKLIAFLLTLLCTQNMQSERLPALDQIHQRYAMLCAPRCFDTDHSMHKTKQRDRYFKERKLFLPMLLMVLYISATRCNGGSGSSLFLSISFLGKVHVGLVSI